MVTTIIISIVLLGQVSADEVYINKLIRTEGLAADRIVPKYCSDQNFAQDVQNIISVNIAEKTYVSALKEARQLFREEIVDNKIDEQCLIWVVRLTYKFSKENKRIAQAKQNEPVISVQTVESVEQAEINRLQQNITETQRVATWITLTEEEKEWNLFFQKFNHNPTITCDSIRWITRNAFKRGYSYGSSKSSKSDIKLSDIGFSRERDRVTYCDAKIPWVSRYGILTEPILVTNLPSSTTITGTMQCKHLCSTIRCNNSESLTVWVEGIDASNLQVGDKWTSKSHFAMIGYKKYETALGSTVSAIHLRPMQQTRTIDELIKIVPPNANTISPVQKGN